MTDSWDANRKKSVRANLDGLLKVYGRDPAERLAICLQFLEEASLKAMSMTELADREHDDAREELVAWIERIGDKLKEADEGILEARAINEDRDKAPRWLRAWPKPSGGSLSEMAQRHLDLATLRYGDPLRPEDELAVLQVYVEECGRRMWKMNHAYEDSAQRAILASQLQRLADAYANPPTIGLERVREPE